MILNICNKQKSNCHEYPRHFNLMSNLNTGDTVFYKDDEMDGNKNAVYHVNLIDLLDKVFVLNSLKYISIDQERHINRYLNQGGTANDIIDTNRLNNETLNPFENMDRILKQLDNFLGSYFGVNHGRFAR